MVILGGCSAPPPPPTDYDEAALAARSLDGGRVMATSDGALDNNGLPGKVLDFSSPELPSFVAALEGISKAEPWGRWTDRGLADEPRILLKTPIQGALVLRLKVRDYFGLNAGQRITVQVGGQSREFVMPADGEVALHYDDVVAADAIVLQIPRASAPSIADSRQMGIGLLRLAVTSE